jgi:hypothetical protein
MESAWRITFYGGTVFSALRRIGGDDLVGFILRKYADRLKLPKHEVLMCSSGSCQLLGLAYEITPHQKPIRKNQIRQLSDLGRRSCFVIAARNTDLFVYQL